MKRVIGVCGSRWDSKKQIPYECALRAAGIEPVLIRPGDTIPPDVSGLVLMGGSDVNPARYGEPRAPETQDPDDARDQLEDALIGGFVGRDRPVLAICRGVQMLNVQQGGTLIQHLDSTSCHQQKTGGDPVHSVEILPGTKLAAIVGEPLCLNVNSRHHQAVGEPGHGLVVSARAEDGTIEAVERPDKRFVIGVQWHPEDQAPHDQRQASIFRAFAAAL